MVKILTRRGALGAALGVSSLAALAACGQDEETPAATTEAPTTDAQTTDTETTTEATTESSPSETEESQAPAAATEVEINTVLEDTEVGDKITIVSAIRNATYPSIADKIAEGSELVLLQVKVTPSGQFGGLVSAGSFRLNKADGDQERYNSRVDEEMKADGKTPLSASRRNGEQTGWVAFLLDEDETAATYEGVYTRAEAKVIGQDKTLAEFQGTFTIPAGA